jgi:hypothetical protein
MGSLVINPFTSDAYSLASLTESMIRLPYNMYGRIGELGLFTDKGISTPVALIEEKGGVLNLLPTIPRGAPNLQNQSAKRKMRSFVIPHIGLDDVVMPEDVQGVRQFGSVDATAAFTDVILDKLQTLRRYHRTL